MFKKIFIISMLIISICSIAKAMSYSEAFEICKDNCGLSYLFDTDQGDISGTDYVSYNTFLNYLDNEIPAQYMFVRKTNSATNNTNFDIVYYEEFNINGNNYTAHNSSNKGGSKKYYYPMNKMYEEVAYSSNGNANGTFPTGNNTFYMVFDGSSIIASSFVPPSLFEYTPNYFQKVFYSGINDEFNALKYDYSISSWKLGTFDKIPDNVDKIIVDLLFHDGGFSFSDSFLTFTKSFNNGYYFINNDNLYVYSRYIKYNTKYNLLFYLYDDNNNFIESYQYNYVFLPTNATIENGVVVNPGSGDYSVQDSTNDTISVLTNSSDVDSIMDEYLSGDVEDVAGELGFTAFDNPFTSFLFFVIDGVYDLLTDTSNVVLEADYKTMHFVLHSDDFFTQDTTLKIFVRDMLICVYIYGNYKYFHYLITLLETARIDKFAAEIGTDEFYDTDIM